MTERGWVKLWNHHRGHGSIAPYDMPGDLFFHIRDVVGDQMRQGQKVTFDVGYNRTGPKAINVRRITENEGDTDD